MTTTKTKTTTTTTIISYASMKAVFTVDQPACTLSRQRCSIFPGSQMRPKDSHRQPPWKKGTRIVSITTTIIITTITTKTTTTTMANTTISAAGKW